MSAHRQPRKLQWVSHLYLWDTDDGCFFNKAHSGSYHSLVYEKAGCLVFPHTIFRCGKKTKFKKPPFSGSVPYNTLWLDSLLFDLLYYCLQRNEELINRQLPTFRSIYSLFVFHIEVPFKVLIFNGGSSYSGILLIIMELF